MKKTFLVVVSFVALISSFAIAEEKVGQNAGIVTVDHVDVSGYFLVEKECVIFDRNLKQITRTLSMSVEVQGQTFSIPVVIVEPQGSLSQEFKNVHLGDFVWLNVRDDGRVLSMNKKKPIITRKK